MNGCMDNVMDVYMCVCVCVCVCVCPVVPQITLNIPLQSKDTQYGHVTCSLMT